MPRQTLASTILAAKGAISYLCANEGWRRRIYYNLATDGHENAIAGILMSLT